MYGFEALTVIAERRAATYTVLLHFLCHQPSEMV